MEKIITCKYCGQKLRIKSDKEGWATCPKCKKTFLTNTAVASGNKKTFINEMKEEQEKLKQAVRQANTSNTSSINRETEELYAKIVDSIKAYVRVNMLDGKAVPVIHHYFYSRYYGYSDIPEEYSLDERLFSVFTDSSRVDLEKLLSMLKKFIIIDIGYQKCEVLLVDKTLIYHYHQANLLGEKVERTRPIPGKAIWIHAAMNNEEYGNYKPYPKNTADSYSGDAY